MKEAFLAAYSCLDAVFRKKAFSGIELNNALKCCSEKNRAVVTKLFYGTLELALKYDYILSLYAKTVKPSVATALKMGLYAFEALNLPQAAAVNETVALIKNLGKGGAAGFANAVMRRATDDLKEGKINFGEDELKAAALKNGFPQWAALRLENDFGRETALKFVSYRQDEAWGHVRYNPFRIELRDFESLLSDRQISFRQGPFKGGYFVKGRLDCVPQDLFTFQSPGSLAGCFVRPAARLCRGEYTPHFLFETSKRKCAAPGGKSVLAAQLSPQAEIVACDIHPHRTDFIEKYAARMGVKNIKVFLNDATVFNREFEDAFDCVLCDAPCSGFGVLSSKPDIKLFRKESDVEELAALQSKILSVAARYVKRGGSLVYSTCTVFKRENDDVVNGFLLENKNFAAEKIDLPVDTACGMEKFARFFPFRDGFDGFFIARLKRLV